MTNSTETVAGLRALADFLEEHPELPVFSVGAHPYLEGPEKDREVDRIAGILNEQPRYTPHAHYIVERDFGGGVIYKAASIPDAVIKQYERDITYHGAVTP